VNFEVSSCTKFRIFHPTGGAYSAPPDTLAGGEGLAGLAAASPTTPPPLSLRASFFFILKHLLAPKRSWKISHWKVLEKSWIF